MESRRSGINRVRDADFRSLLSPCLATIYFQFAFSLRPITRLPRASSPTSNPLIGRGKTALEMRFAPKINKEIRARF